MSEPQVLWKGNELVGPIMVVSAGKKRIRGTLVGKEKVETFLLADGYHVLSQYGSDAAEQRVLDKRRIQGANREAHILHKGPIQKCLYDFWQRELLPPIVRLSDDKLQKLEAALRQVNEILSEVPDVRR